MKGYSVLAVVVTVILLMLPPVFVNKPSQTPAQPTASSVQTEDVFTVLHTDGNQISSMNAYDLTLYATAAAITRETPPEAIKAQAVACYTGFCYQRLGKSKQEADVRTTATPFPQTFCDEYWKDAWGEHYDTVMRSLRAAVDAVKGETVCYKGKPIMALYHALNTGMTENGAVLLTHELPYLVSVASPADALSEHQLTSVTCSVQEARDVLRTMCGDAVGDDASTWFTDITKTDVGTVTTARVCGVDVTGEQLRAAFSLPSASFEVDVQEGHIIFTVRGSGHFVGLSQYGAAHMASEGKGYKEILKHYYQGTSVQ